MIRRTKLSKFYGGKRALGPVSFEIEDGETVGFLGLNGAGKTTALRILACDLRPIAGIDRGRWRRRGRRSARGPQAHRLPAGEPAALHGHGVADYLRFAGELRGMTRRRGQEAAARGPRGHRSHATSRTTSIGTLSHGYRQRVGVAQAIIHQPKFLILDEPTRGLDPVQIVEMRNLIHDLKQSHTVLISSHILTEISQTCDRLLVLGKGKLLGAGSEDELARTRARFGRSPSTVRAPSGDDAARRRSRKVLERGRRRQQGRRPVRAGRRLPFSLSTTKDCRAEVSRAVVEAKLDLIKLDYARSELENTFIRLVGGADASN